MKIICDNQEEYDQLMKTSKYLHDFVIFIENKIGVTEISFNEGDNLFLRGQKEIKCIGLDGEFNLVGFIQHLYLDEEDFPNKKEIVRLKDRRDEICPICHESFL